MALSLSTSPTFSLYNHPNILSLKSQPQHHLLLTPTSFTPLRYRTYTYTLNISFATYSCLLYISLFLQYNFWLFLLDYLQLSLKMEQDSSIYWVQNVVVLVVQFVTEVSEEEHCFRLVIFNGSPPFHLRIAPLIFTTLILIVIIIVLNTLLTFCECFIKFG